MSSISKTQSRLVACTSERPSEHSPCFSTSKHSPTLLSIVNNEPRYFTRTKPGLMWTGSGARPEYTEAFTFAICAPVFGHPQTHTPGFAASQLP